MRSSRFLKIPAYLDISWHISPNIIRHIQNLRNADIFRNLLYTESWFIQNPDIFRTRHIFRILVYPESRHIQSPISEPWHIQNQRHSELWYIQNPVTFRAPERFVKIVNLLYKINIMSFFKTGVSFALNSIYYLGHKT